jgi:hypothetical protein
MHEIAGAPFTVSDRVVGIFIKSGAVEVPQSIVIDREMNRDNVQNDADVILMALIDKLP